MDIVVRWRRAPIIERWLNWLVATNNNNARVSLSLSFWLRYRPSAGASSLPPQSPQQQHQQQPQQPRERYFAAAGRDSPLAALSAVKGGGRRHQVSTAALNISMTGDGGGGGAGGTVLSQQHQQPQQEHRVDVQQQPLLRLDTILAGHDHAMSDSGGDSGSGGGGGGLHRSIAPGSSCDIQQHLQSMFHLLRAEETLKMVSLTILN